MTECGVRMPRDRGQFSEKSVLIFFRFILFVARYVACSHMFYAHNISVLLDFCCCHITDYVAGLCKYRNMGASHNVLLLFRD